MPSHISTSDSAITSAAAHINSLLVGVTDHGPTPGFRNRRPETHRMLTVEVNLGLVLGRLANFGLAINQTAMLALQSRGGEWVAMIRRFTPEGPVRIMPPDLNEESGFYSPRLKAWPADVYSYKIWEREAKAALAALDKTHHDAEEVHRLDLAADLIRGGFGRFQPHPKFKFGGEGSEGSFGSLWSSIAVATHRGTGGAGAVQLEAYSNNHYAAYVEKGFDHALVPMLRLQVGDGQDVKLMKRKYKMYTTLSVGRLGQSAEHDPRGYAIWDVLQAGGKFASDNGVSAQSAQAGFAYDKLKGQLTPGSGVVDFAVRKKYKHQEGKHMFEFGTEDFLSTAIPAWKRDVDQIARNAWNRGLVWHRDAKRYQPRERKGRPGGGQFRSPKIG